MRITRCSPERYGPTFRSAWCDGVMARFPPTSSVSLRRRKSMEQDRSKGTSETEDGGPPALKPLDDLVTRSTQAIARLTRPRRHFLNRVGKLALALTGASIAQVLPLDREVPIANAQASNCNDWSMCGIFADRVCSCACGSNSCPSGTSNGGFWTACCATAGAIIRVKYLDCCKGSNPNTCCSKAGCECYRTGGAPAYCSGGLAQLCCTVVSFIGTC
jgi:hypothetical protein